MDISTHDNGTETITVIARRPTRTWRSEVAEHLNDPRNSEAARPRDAFAPARPYCNSTLRTVAGQPGTAADMMAGAGAGAC